MMHLLRPFLGASLALFIALGSPLAAAQATFEITPFAGGRVGGSFDYEDQASGEEESVDLDSGFSYGLDLGLYAHETGFYELLYSRMATSLDGGSATLDGLDVDVNYLQVGGTAFFPGERAYVPYLSFTLGATFFEPDGDFDSLTRFSGSLGGGFRFPVSDHTSVVLGLRGYLTLLDSDTGVFCVSDGGQGGCLIKSSGSTFFQAEAQVGVAFSF